MPLLWPSTRSARSAVAVVKSTVWPASTTARPRAIARWVLPTPGGTVTYCAVSALRRHPLCLAPPCRRAPDRQEHPASARRSARLAVSAARWHVDLPPGMDDLARAVRALGARRRPLRL